MKVWKSSRWALRMGISVVWLVSLALVGPLAPMARAQTTITNCAPDQAAGIVSQLEAGGVIAFACPASSVVIVPDTIDITQNTTIDGGANGVTLSGGDTRRVFTVAAGVTLAVRFVTITDGLSAGGNGGALLNDGGSVTLIDSAVTSSRTELGSPQNGDGGGIGNVSGGTLVLTRTLVVDNAGRNAGGITNLGGALTITDSTITGNTAAGGGGGIVNESGMATVTGSTFTDNYAGGGGGGIINANDGARLMLTNSTISGNQAGNNGGGMTTLSDALSEIVSSTIHGNSAVFGGNLSAVFSGAQSLANTIVADSLIGANCSTSFDGVTTSSGYNLSDDASCINAIGSDRPSVAFDLPDPADNGGPTNTIALLPDSPAIDTGSCLNPFTDPDTTFAIDQRGFPRPYDVAGVLNTADGCDVGAVEFQGIANEFLELRTAELEPFPGIVNQQAGDPIYVRFSLGDALGTGIVTSVRVQRIDCASGTPIGSSVPAQSIGGLKYFSGPAYYLYIWRTQGSWAGTCRQLIVQFSDGSAARFNVEFVRNR